MVRCPVAGKDFIMARIGSFKQVAGEYRGEISTLTIAAKAVRIAPADSAGGNAPSHRVFAGDLEVGAGWEKRTRDDRPYLSVKLDDPSFAEPIFAQLFAADEGAFDLVWSRAARRSD